MKPISAELYLFVASYAPWGRSPSIPAGLFQVLEPVLRPDRFDENDPARRKYTGTQEDIDFWLKKTPDALGRWLHIKKKGRKQSYSFVIDWVDPEHEWVRNRGDYSKLYGSLKGIPTEAVVQVWRELCRHLHPFHAFLDTFDQYKRRAQKVRGWYFERLPGLFAYNFFGKVYEKNWGPKVLASLPEEFVTRTENGFFLRAPSGLDMSGERQGAYSPEDWAIIKTIGEGRFHLPQQESKAVQAPSLTEFRAATPQSAE